MKVIILAAGFGTRLYPLTKRIPKALLSIGGLPNLNHIMDKIHQNPEIEETIIVSNNRFYEDFVIWSMESLFEKPVRIVNNGVDFPKDQKGSIKDLEFGMEKAANVERNGFLVIHSDNYFNFDLNAFIKICVETPSLPRIGLYEFKDISQIKSYGIVGIEKITNPIPNLEGKTVDSEGGYISTGICYFPTSVQFRVREYLFCENQNPDRIGDFLAWLVHKKEVHAFVFKGLWSDIGSFEDLKKTRRWMNGKMRPESPFQISLN